MWNELPNYCMYKENESLLVFLALHPLWCVVNTYINSPGARQFHALFRILPFKWNDREFNSQRTILPIWYVIYIVPVTKRKKAGKWSNMPFLFTLISSFNFFFFLGFPFTLTGHIHFHLFIYFFIWQFCQHQAFSKRLGPLSPIIMCPSLLRKISF